MLEFYNTTIFYGVYKITNFVDFDDFAWNDNIYHFCNKN
jgi:hypothetical protein